MTHLRQSPAPRPSAASVEQLTLADVYRARQVVYRYLPRTPLVEFPALSRRLGCAAYLKLENLQPIGAFKVRGGVNLVAGLTAAERERGVITASTGNHGQSIAYAAKLFGVRAIVAVPEGANPLKVAAMEALGAEVVAVGRDVDDARAWAERTAAERGYRFVHFADEPALVAGVATLSLELIEDLPDVEVIITPVGAGSGAAGHCLVARTLNPSIRLIAVQAEGAPAAYQAWRSGAPVETATPQTFAEGLAARLSWPGQQAIMRRGLDDFLLVSDDELRAAIRLLLETTHQVAEGAGAASTAAALRLAPELAGRKVALVLSGGNLALETLREILA